MNLIEQLGGYENSKGLFSRYDHAITFKYYSNYVEDSNNFVDVFVPDLKQALLQCRREHNIFEVGDKVLITDDFHDKDVVDLVFNIFSVNQEDQVAHIFVDFKNKDGGMTHYGISGQWFEHMRLATPEEIQAGRRLEVCGG